MSDPTEIKRRTVSLRVDGNGRATADVAFTDRADHDEDAFAPGALQDATVPLNRNHELLLGGDRPPFGIARISRRGDRHGAEIEFLNTERGRDEHETAKALHAAGVTQPVSIGFRVESVGTVPEHLRSSVKRYITKAQPIELSLVGAGAIPSAQLVSVKRASRNPDRALVREVKRFQAHMDCLREPYGALAWDVAQCGARWLTGGVIQQGPAVKWFDFDGKRAGYWTPGSDEIHISRNLGLKQTIMTCGHEVGHWWYAWDPSEETARTASTFITKRYLEKMEAEAV
jgi:phage head maturation protease